MPGSGTRTAAGLERGPDYIGAHMGSIDLGPYCLGSGELATAAATTRADLNRLLRAAPKLDIPLLIGTASAPDSAPQTSPLRPASCRTPA
jgi:hypothetical protein